MRTCPSCGGTSPSHAQWCGQCYAEYPAPAMAASSAAGSVAPGFHSPSPVGHLGTPAAAALPTGAPVQPPPPPGSDGRMLQGRALTLAVVAILVGALASAVGWFFLRDDGILPETALRYAIVIDLAVYAVVGTLLVTQITPGIRLRWSPRDPAVSILIGAGIGGGVGAVMLAIITAASGHLATDPRIVTIMSEGDVAHLAVAVLLACVCAPLVEEVLFRGLLLEAMRRDVARALLVSCAAFAVWHLNPKALRYYALMGLMFGAIYLKRGLVGSMAAHVAFNGVLTVAGMAIVLAPAKVVTVGDATISAPGGWSVAERNSTQVDLSGPSGAELLLEEIPTSNPATVDTVVRRIINGRLATALPELQIDASTARRLDLPAGPAVAVDFVGFGERGTLVAVPQPSASVTVLFTSGGSAKARADFPKMLDSLRVGAA